MIKVFLCSLPLLVKVSLANLITYANIKKKRAIRKIANLSSIDFVSLNTYEYKKNLSRFLCACFYSAKDTSDYIDFLYRDKVTLIYEGLFDKSKPSIICVIKNEIDKLDAFFSHYKALGEFNYIFIDNGSSDDSVEIIRRNHGAIYSCMEQFSTNRKLAWINMVYSTIPNGMWTILLDADELLVYDGYERQSMNSILKAFEQKGIKSAGAVMIDMFSNEPVKRDEYLDKYVYFENTFHEKQSYYFNSVYGGIREREFKFSNERIFLIKKHPVVKKEDKTMLIHCHYNYPFDRNIQSKIYFGLLHYKLFDNELEKYRKIAAEGNYGNNSVEYKNYSYILNNKTYEQIFTIGNRTEKFVGTDSLRRIDCLLDVGVEFNE